MRRSVRAALFTSALLAFAAPGLAAQTPESKACSDQATAKGLHGADRETFRTACMKGAAPAAPAAKPAAAAKPATAPMASLTPTAAKPAGFAAKSPASQACSDQATAKGLHGADREKFRDACLKGAAPVAAPAPAKPVAPMAAPVAAKPVAPMAAPAPKPIAPMATVAPPEPGSVAAKAVKVPGTRSPAQLAADARIHACGQQWQAAKAAGKLPAGQKWPQYWSACSARMKAAG